MRWRKPTPGSLSGLAASGPVRARKPEPHQGAAVLGTPGADPASVGFCHLLDDRQAQPGAGQLSGSRSTVEAVEHIREIVFVNAWAVVAHDHLALAHVDLHPAT